MAGLRRATWGLLFCFAIAGGSAKAEPILSAGYPISSNNLFSSPSGGVSAANAAAVDPELRSVWFAGKGYSEQGGYTHTDGALLTLDPGGNFSEPVRFSLEALLGGCGRGGFDYCQAGSAASVEGLAFSPSPTRLWAVGVQVDAGGSNPVLIAGALDPATRRFTGNFRTGRISVPFMVAFHERNAFAFDCIGNYYNRRSFFASQSRSFLIGFINFLIIVTVYFKHFPSESFPFVHKRLKTHNVFGVAVNL